MSASAASESILLVHLSDIHFSKPSLGGEGKLDEDIRNEVRNDVLRMAAELGTIHGFIVTGDIAYSGKEEEYRQAEAWLLELCQKTGCKEEDVWVICGNHDIQRPIIDSSKIVRTFHKELRSCKVDEINNTVAEYLRDHAGKTEIFSPLKNYNAFAAKFGGHFSADQLYWQEDLRLNDGSRLRIRGLNSALCSNKEDDADKAKLVVGSAQCVLDRANALEYLIMCHHPPEWLRDHDNVLEFLESRARLILFGHKHKLRVQVRKTKGFDCLHLHAGAINPERHDGTRPHYNFLRLRVDADTAKKTRTLRVELYPRVWGGQTEFIADAEECEKGLSCRVYQLSLDWLEIKPLTAEAATPIQDLISQTQVSDPLSVSPIAASRSQSMSGTRRLAFRFLSLPYHHRMEVAHELRLLEAADSHIDDTELFKRLFRRAAERNLLSAFYKAVEMKHTGQSPAENPFA